MNNIKLDKENSDYLIKGLMNKILMKISKTDLIHTLVHKIGDNLSRYHKKEKSIDGKEVYTINSLKVPVKLYIVAIVKEIEIAIENHGSGLVYRHYVFYMYNGKFWDKVLDESIKNFMLEAVIRLGYYSPAEAMTRKFKEAIFQQYITSSYQDKYPNDSSTVLINLHNGTFEISAEESKLREHRKEDFITYVLPFSYDINAKAYLYHKYLNRVLPDESSQQILKEFHGYIFTRNLKLEKALVLYGSGKNGKSVQFEVTNALLGQYNVSTKTLKDLSNQDSGADNLASLDGKLVNYGSEISAQHMDFDLLKRLISGEPVSVRRKYQSSFDLQDYCKFIFNANKLPMQIENTEAYFRRFLIIPYNCEILENEIDPDLHRKIIKSELSGIFNWAVQGLNDILKNKKFSECKAAKEALNTYRKESNSVAMMFDDDEYYLDRSENNFIPTISLYNTYKRYCTESKLRALTRNEFGKELIRLGFKKHRTGNNRGFCIPKKVSNDSYDTFSQNY